MLSKFILFSPSINISSINSKTSGVATSWAICDPPSESGIITFSAPAIFNFFTELDLEALAIILSFGFNSLAVKTTNKLSASDGRVVINALALLIPHFRSNSSFVASPSAQLISVFVLK